MCGVVAREPFLLLSRLMSLGGSGISHNPSSLGSSLMSSLSKNRFRDSEFCTKSLTLRDITFCFPDVHSASDELCISSLCLAASFFRVNLYTLCLDLFFH